MDVMDLLAFIKNTYGLTVALKNNLSGLKLDKMEQVGITALGIHWSRTYIIST